MEIWGQPISYCADKMKVSNNIGKIALLWPELGEEEEE